MNRATDSLFALQRPTRVRYGVLGFACALSMITYLDRVCFGTAMLFIKSEFGLSDTQKGWLFTAFGLAYALFEVPSGWMGDVFGPRRTLIRIVLWWSLFTALTGLIYPSLDWPWFAFTAMFIVRFLFGMGEAGAYPNIARAFHSWFPLQERGFAQGAVWMAGRLAGGLSPFLWLALIFHTRTPDGQTVVHWRHPFWIFGGLGVLWCLAFRSWFRDHPEQHPSLNAAERDLIQGRVLSAEPSATVKLLPSPTEKKEAALQTATHANVPWLRLLGSGNLWLLCLMYFCASYGWYFNITWLPDYLASQYHVSQETHGFWTMSLLSGAPLLLGSLACVVGGLLTDAFVRRTGDRKWGRRLFGMLGHGICALCYFFSLAASSPWLFVLAVALAAFWNDLTMGSAWASCIDIGRHYSGIVSGCMNTVGNLGGAAAGIATGWIVQSFPSHGWTINVLIFGGVYVLAMLLWLRFDATKPLVPEKATV
jgi:ACS family glucarate transporter-like MFS transporter